jgi:hypothetical protein
VGELVDELLQLGDVSLFPESRILRVLSVAVSAAAGEKTLAVEFTFVEIFLQMTFAFSFGSLCRCRLHRRDIVGRLLQLRRLEVVFLELENEKKARRGSCDHCM